MDPITHGVIGLAISAFSGETVSLSSPIALGAALGAMSPDLDFVIRILKNDMVYLKQHRGLSHSIPALAVFSGIIAAGLFAAMPSGHAFLTIWLWSFIGALSHTAFDALNSYGAMFFTKKRKANLLTLYDPVISLMAVYLIFFNQQTVLSNVEVIASFFGYLVYRYYKREQARVYLEAHFEKQYKNRTVSVLPGLKFFYKWDFIVTSKSHSVVGNYNAFTKEIKVIKRFENIDSSYLDAFKLSRVGQYFEDWTPHYHIEAEAIDEGVHLKAIDLRYYFKNDFMHHATLVLSHDFDVIKGYIHPYAFHKKISVNEAA